MRKRKGREKGEKEREREKREREKRERKGRERNLPIVMPSTMRWSADQLTFIICSKQTRREREREKEREKDRNDVRHPNNNNNNNNNKTYWAQHCRWRRNAANAALCPNRR
jgi:hypothetical protein